MEHMDITRPPRRLLAAQVLAAVVDGLALSTIVVHAVTGLQIGPARIGLLMATGAAVALVAAPLLGPVLDRIGLARGAAAGSLLTAAALIGYATAPGVGLLAVSVATFMTAQAISGAARQGLAATGSAVDTRHRHRATMHTLLNVGLGLGTVVGALLTLLGSVVTGYLVAAAGSVLVALLVATVETPASRQTPSGGVLIALRDRRFRTALALAVLLQLTMPILSVLLPVWVVTSTAAGGWVAPLGLGINTMLVILCQRWWSARLDGPRRIRRSARIAALGAIAAGVCLPLAITVPGAAIGLVLTGVVAITVVEVAGGAAIWRVALDEVPAAAEGRYQAAFSMSASGARVLGPLVALPLVIVAPSAGWLLIAATLAAAALGVAALAGAGRRGSRHTPSQPAPSQQAPSQPAPSQGGPTAHHHTTIGA